MGIIYFRFGVSKFFPGLSLVEEIAGKTMELIGFGLITPAVSLPLLAVWRMLIGIARIVGTARGRRKNSSMY